MAIEWEETVETKRKVRLAVDPVGTSSAVNRAATIDDLRRACEAVGLVVETRESMDNWASAVHDAERDRLACLDALSEHVSPDATADTPRMTRPSSVLAGIRALQARLRDARSDLREHDADLEAANTRAEKAEARIAAAETEAGISLAALALGYVRACKRLGVERDQLGIGLGRVLAERDDLRAKLEKALSILGRDLTAARDRIAELEGEKVRADAWQETAIRAESAEGAANSAVTELQELLDEVTAERDLANGVNRRAAQTIIECIGSVGPEDADSAAERIVSRVIELEAQRDAARSVVDLLHKVLTEARVPTSLDVVERVRCLVRRAELEAPLPEATEEELFQAFDAGRIAVRHEHDIDRDRAGIRAVAERVRRERPPCLIARAVAGGVGFEMWKQEGDIWKVRVGIHGKTYAYIPAAEVPAELARMLTEVGA